MKTVDVYCLRRKKIKYCFFSKCVRRIIWQIFHKNLRKRGIPFMIYLRSKEILKPIFLHTKEDSCSCFCCSMFDLIEY